MNGALRSPLKLSGSKPWRWINRQQGSLRCVRPTNPKDPEGFTYSRSRAPRLWAGDELLGAVVLAEEELNLRYVAVTRAEAECLSATWTAPMFSELEAYR